MRFALRNDDEALDVAQEVFVEVYGSIDKFRGESKLSTWLFRIAVNRSLDQLRHRNRQKRMSQVSQLLRIGQNNAAEQIKAETTPFEQLENNDRQRALNFSIVEISRKSARGFYLE